MAQKSGPTFHSSRQLKTLCGVNKNERVKKTSSTYTCKTKSKCVSVGAVLAHGHLIGVNGQPKALARLPHIIGGWFVSRASLDILGEEKKLLSLMGRPEILRFVIGPFSSARITLSKSLLSTPLLQAFRLVLFEMMFKINASILIRSTWLSCCVYVFECGAICGE